MPGLPDVILYFGPLEFALVALALLTLPIGYFVLRNRARWSQHFSRLLDALPYPAMIFRRRGVAFSNAHGMDWLGNLALEGLAADAIRGRQNILRTIPAVEGQTYQARAIPLNPSETLLMMEDLGATQRQQAFYRNFIQNVSHELKTPLTVIQGHAAKMAGAPDDTAGWQASLHIIGEESKRLTQLVDNLLTLARLESPSFALERAPMSVAALLEESVLQLSELADEKQIALDLTLAPGLPRLNADFPRLKQATLNLLDNALKFTPAGGRVEVRAEHDPETSQIRVSVADNGEGIPAEDQPYIFDRLYRVRRIGGRPVEGSGLGLTLVQQIVRAHGGDIHVESAPGAGSTFVFALPCGQERGGSVASDGG